MPTSALEVVSRSAPPTFAPSAVVFRIARPDAAWKPDDSMWYIASVMLLALVFLSAMSVVGDLLESLLNRSAGVKDSSGLLPGHGGVLDRVDALLPVLPLAMMLISWAPSQTL